MNQYFNDKSSIFLTKVNFDTSEENQLSYFQNGYFFKYLWWYHEAHEGKEIKHFFELFINEKIDHTFVWFISNKSLPLCCTRQQFKFIKRFSEFIKTFQLCQNQRPLFTSQKLHLPFTWSINKIIPVSIASVVALQLFMGNINISKK